MLTIPLGLLANLYRTCFVYIGSGTITKQLGGKIHCETMTWYDRIWCWMQFQCCFNTLCISTFAWYNLTPTQLTSSMLLDIGFFKEKWVPTISLPTQSVFSDFLVVWHEINKIMGDVLVTENLPSHNIMSCLCLL